MKKIAPILTIALVIAQLCYAQAYKNEKLIYLDANGEKTREKKADVLEQLIKFNDTLYEINLYRIDGPMFKSFFANTPDGALTGSYKTYDANGRLDSMGTFDAGRPSGKWSVYSNGRFTKELWYEDGKLAETKDMLQLKQKSDAMAAARKKDSTGSGDKIFTKVEIESAFPGGPAAWLTYLNKNLHYPDKAVKDRIQGMVIIAFVVDKQGHVPPGKVFVDRSVEYSLDQEALRIILTSHDWTPAVQNGRAVNSYKKQPVVFRLEAK